MLGQPSVLASAATSVRRAVSLVHVRLAEMRAVSVEPGPAQPDAPDPVEKLTIDWLPLCGLVR